MKDKISIITTVYNSENYILECIDSVNKQLIDNIDIEYIIIDDASTDKSVELIHAYFKKKPSDIDVKIFELKENIGCGAARQYGIKHSSGNYVMFLDSDDYYLNNDFIKRAYNTIKSNNADIVEYGFKYTDIHGIQQNLVSDNQYSIKNDHISNLILMLSDNLIKFMPWNKIIKRSIIDTHEYSNYREFEDMRTTPYWVYNANNIIIMNSVEVNYRLTKSSIIRNNSNYTRVETVKALLELAESFNDNKLILKHIYKRAFIDIKTIIKLNSNDTYYCNMSKLNTKLLSLIYPDNYKDFTFDVENNNM